MTLVTELKKVIETYKQTHDDFVPFDVITKSIVVSFMQRYYDISEFKLIPLCTDEDRVQGCIDIHPPGYKHRKIYFQITQNMTKIITEEDYNYNRAMKGV